MDTQEILGQAYRPRVIDRQVARFLGGAGAVIIEGPRGCGKTMTGLHHASSYVFLDDPAARTLGELSPTALLAGDRPRLLDEWQTTPDVWNLARRAVDRSTAAGQFILTGSAVPTQDPVRHTGAARFLRVRERTMTWAEKHDALSAPGGVSLESLWQRAEAPAPSPEPAGGLGEVVDALLTPGFPGLMRTDSSLWVDFMRSYLEDMATSDIHRISQVRAEPDVVRQLIVALARSTASKVSTATLAKDIARTLPQPDPRTVAKLLELLGRMFLVEEVPSWSVRLRSKARLRKSGKYHLADPALAAAALYADRERLLADRETLGFLFESAVVHDLMVYAEALGGRVHHYRDSNGHEIDAVLTFPDGRWAAVEVKLGAGQIVTGAARLAAAVAQVDAPDPAFRAVITGTGPTLLLDDGTVTFPLQQLRP